MDVKIVGNMELASIQGHFKSRDDNLLVSYYDSNDNPRCYYYSRSVIGKHVFA